MSVQSGLANPSRPSLGSAHSMVMAAGIGVLFVLLAVVLAGMGNTWGNAMIALMVLMLMVQAIVNVDMFAKFAESVQITPPQ